MTTATPRSVCPRRERGRRFGARARIAAAAIIATGGLLLSTACSAGGSGPAANEDEIGIAIAVAPVSLEPGQLGNLADWQMLMSLAYEPLIRLQPDGSLEPGLATDWEYTDDTLTTFQLTLRDDAKFSDGEPVTADSVVQSIAYLKASVAGSAAIYGTTIESAEAVDDLTVQLNLAQPNPLMAMQLTERFFIGTVISPKGLADPEALGTTTAGAGQYMIDEAQSVGGDHYTYVPNPNYYDPSAINFEKFTVRVIPNPQTAVNAVKSGQVAFTIGNSTSVSQAETDGLQISAAASSFTTVFILDRTGELVPALGDERVRQALNYAVDREAISKSIVGEYGGPLNQFSVPGYEDQGYDPDYTDAYAYDPEKARELLADAGYADGFTVSLAGTAEWGNGVQVAQAIAGYWEEVGVTTEIDSYSSIADMAPRTGSKEVPTAVVGIDGQPLYIAANQFFVPGPWNPFLAEDEELSALMAAAYAETDLEKLPAAWEAIQHRVVDLGWFLPISTMSSLYYSSPDLKGVDVSQLAFVPYPPNFHY